MFKKALCLHYCYKEFAEDNHENKIIENLKNKKIFKEITTNTKNMTEKIMSLPHGTLFSRDLNSGKIYVSLPFFSSHLRLPVKEGEYVWVYEEENEFNSINSISNSYWLSRIHGLLFSEDVNYTYNVRDRLLNLQKILNGKQNKQLDDFYVRLPTNSSYENITSLDKSTETNVPRYFGNQKDLTIQGSNNTLINLSNEKESDGNYLNSKSKEGKITLVAGRGCYYKKSKYLSETKIKTKTIRTIKNLESNFENAKVLSNSSQDSTLSNSIYNNLDQEENFKLPELVTSKNKNSLKRNTREGAESLKYDASTITISENSSNNLTKEYKSFSMRNIDNLMFEENSISISDSLGLKKAFSDKKITKISSSNFKKSGTNTKSPSICIYSTDIHIISRNDSYLNNSYNDGAIYLIKNSESIKKYGEVSLRENGNVILNGNKILIGNYEREEKKENGLGSTVIIGNGGDLNSLVLGEKLVLVLTEMLEINKNALQLISDSLAETKSNFDTCNDNFNSINSWANSHTHPVISISAPSGPTNPPSQPPILINSLDIDKGSSSIINKQDPKLSDKLDELIFKMDSILSKFTKTS